jgi:hypothetical protein
VDEPIRTHGFSSSVRASFLFLFFGNIFGLRFVSFRGIMMK